jgi:hypothetical protein
MAATKQDNSGVFSVELKAKQPRKEAVLDRVSHLSLKGVTFLTERFLPEWMEVDVEMHLPEAETQRDRHVDCRGVVVQCVPRQKGKGFEVSLVFLNLPKRIGPQLAGTPAKPSYVSITC